MSKLLCITKNTKESQDCRCGEPAEMGLSNSRQNNLLTNKVESPGLEIISVEIQWVVGPFPCDVSWWVVNICPGFHVSIDKISLYIFLYVVSFQQP